MDACAWLHRPGRASDDPDAHELDPTLWRPGDLVRGERRWSVDFDRCLPVFNEHHGCGVCLAACPWNYPDVALTLVRKLAARRARASTAGQYRGQPISARVHVHRPAGMRRLYFAGLLELACVELAAVRCIMPFPGSQRIRSLALAHALHTWRWPVRVAFGTLALAGLPAAWRAAARRRWRWSVVATAAVAAASVYAANVGMAADHIFRTPRTLVLRPAATNRVEPGRLVVGVDLGGASPPSPVCFISYHP